ncbi:MAG: hypothetical protein WBB25_07585 [Sulfitobacter sp.]
MAWAWIIASILGVVALICFAQYRGARATYTPLANRQPERRAVGGVPLGMEAIDLDSVNSAARRNESLERGHTNWTNRGGIAAATDVAPMADDETYAKRFHTAFIKDKKHKDQTS